MHPNGLVKIGNVRDGQPRRIGNIRGGAIGTPDASAPVLVSSNLYGTRRAVRRQDNDDDPWHDYQIIRRGHRPSWSPTYEPRDVRGIGRVGEMPPSSSRAIAPIAPVRTPEWQEKEVVPGLRICVRQGQRWSAEKLDSGQVLLTPSRGQVSGEVGAGALMRDTDGYTKEIDDPIPQPGGTRW